MSYEEIINTRTLFNKNFQMPFQLCDFNTTNFLFVLNMQNNIFPTFGRLSSCICDLHKEKWEYEWISISTRNISMSPFEFFDTHTSSSGHLKLAFQTANSTLRQNSQTLGEHDDIFIFIKFVCETPNGCRTTSWFHKYQFHPLKIRSLSSTGILPE